MHGSRKSLDEFMRWLHSKIVAMSKQKSLNKNQLQELLLGISICLRDHDLSSITDHEETPVPDYLVSSKMVRKDATSIKAALDLLFDILDDSEYVFCNTGLHKY